MSKILILANHYNTLRIFRKELLIRFSQDGHEVIVSIPPCEPENEELIRSYDCKVIITPEMDRRGINPLRDLALFYTYCRLMKAEKPDIVITYTVKPNIYGSLAADHAGVKHYANVTGLGSAFSANRGMMRSLVSVLYRISLKSAEKVFFENIGNRDTLVNAGIVRGKQAVVMPGAGVNLEDFHPVPYPENDDPVVFLFVGRIMREKGIDELLSAEKRLKAAYPNVRFDFIGWYEDQYKERVEQLQAEGLINFYGFQPDVKPYIAKAHCIVLPSWHEGMSNTLQEAAAMGRPLIASDIHGCKEAVIDGETGFLTEVKSVDSIYNAMDRFMCLNHVQKIEMGISGRRHMEICFDKKNVVEMTIQELIL